MLYCFFKQKVDAIDSTLTLRKTSQRYEMAAFLAMFQCHMCGLFLRTVVPESLSCMYVWLHAFFVTEDDVLFPLLGRIFLTPLISNFIRQTLINIFRTPIKNQKMKTIH